MLPTYPPLFLYMLPLFLAGVSNVPHYNLCLLVTVFCFLVTNVLLILFYALSYFLFESISLNQVSFECGFDPGADMTLSPLFVIRHMVVAIFFLVFDLELLLLAPGLLSFDIDSVSDSVIVALIMTFMLEVEFNVFQLN